MFYYPSYFEFINNRRLYNFLWLRVKIKIFTFKLLLFIISIIMLNRMFYKSIFNSIYRSYLISKADIADSKTLTMKNNLSDWIFLRGDFTTKVFRL